MNECTRTMEEVVDGWEEGAPRSPEARSHLEACERCRAEAERVLSLMSETAGAPVPDPGEEYWRNLPGRIRLRIDREKAALPPSRLRVLPVSRWVFYPAAAAAAALLVLLALVPGAREVSSEDLELARIEEDLDAALSRADLEAGGVLESWNEESGTGEAATLDDAFLAEMEDQDIDQVDQAFDSVVALLSPGEDPEWSDIDQLLLELTPEEMGSLKEELVPADSGTEDEIVEENAG